MMRTLFRFLVPAFAAALAIASGPAAAADPVPKHNYICPRVDNAVAPDCFFDAVAHLYTMCRLTKEIEIIEFGFEKSEEGVNGAKTESCIDKQKLNMTRPYQAALRESTRSRQAVETVRGLHEIWLASLKDLKWRPGESGDEYKLRISKPYEVFKERIQVIRTAMDNPDKPAPKKSAKGTAAPAPAKAKN